MSGFDSGAALEVLDWDFTKYCGPDAKGTTPEPSQDVLDRFRRTRGELLRLAFADDGITIDRAKLAKVVEDAGGEKAFDDKTGQELLDCYTDVCQGSPSREQIEGLPGTVRGAFYRWVDRCLLDPTSRTPDTTP